MLDEVGDTSSHGTSGCSETSIASDLTCSGFALLESVEAIERTPGIFSADSAELLEFIDAGGEVHRKCPRAWTLLRTFMAVGTA